MENQELIDTPHFSDYYYVVMKQKWVVIVVIIASILLIALYNAFSPSVYKATATILIGREKDVSGEMNGQEREVESFSSETLTFNTHFALIKSDPVLTKVIKKLGLDKPDARTMETSIFSQIFSSIKANVVALFGKLSKPASEEATLLNTLDELQDKITIEQVKDTRLLRIHVVDQDPKQAQSIANAVADEYLSYDLGNKHSSSQNSLEWMTEQAYDLRKKLQESEQAFNSFREKEQVYSIEGTQQQIAQKISEFNDNLIKIRNDRLQLESQVAEIKRQLGKGGDLAEIRLLIQSPMAETLYSKLIDLQLEKTTTAQTYGEMHPKMIKLNEDIKDVQNQLKAEINKVLRNLNTRIDLLNRQEENAKRQIADFNSQAVSTNRKQLQYTILQRNTEAQQHLYDALMNRLTESNVIKDVGSSNLRIAEEASVPLYPVLPRKGLNIALGTAFGIMLGLILAFVIEYTDRSIRTEDDIQRYLKYPVLAVIPMVDKKHNYGRGYGQYSSEPGKKKSGSRKASSKGEAQAG
jgi:succinoglycan biosynthesis transport protein ExoP